MKTDRLRDLYLSFFKAKDHKVFASDSLVPQDPTVLFTSAGMNQFKPYFLGEKKDASRAASCQKCLRTDDIDEVGRTPFHHTFFEMLGNFSFGDYFKEGAIVYAWEFLVDVLGVSSKDLWVSVYAEDQEAYTIWDKKINISAARIVRLGEDKNFWPASAPSLGPNGPCGPCSEIFFDKGADTGCGRKECNPACSCGRFVEVWNLVFTQFNRIKTGQLEPLPQKNIDTGMGLERMASVLQKKESNFQIDSLLPALIGAKKIIGLKRTSQKDDALLCAIVDHTRAATFAINDGVFPSNEERGYVIRKLIRKAAWNSYTLGMNKPHLFRLVDIFGQLMQRPYPEITQNVQKISQVIRREEEKFLASLKGARAQFQTVAASLKKENLHVVDAAMAFRLYDTYGFPLELTKDLAREHDFDVDEAGFVQLLEQQKDISRQKSMFCNSIFTGSDHDICESVEFLGYTSFSSEALILRIIKGREDASRLAAGEEGILILDRTPFYPESGGQSADRGFIETKSALFKVSGVQKVKDAILHHGVVVKGVLRQSSCRAYIDQARRRALARAHTATHLLQAALRAVLGEHVTQQGSFVDEDRLRFDFTHFTGLSRDEIASVENKVNEYIFCSDHVSKEVTSFQDAKEKGALAFFKDKYGDQVRMVRIGEYSTELCGGTHLENTAEVALFLITAESSISSGIRRIEALVGKSAYRKALSWRDELRRVAVSLKVTEDKVADAVLHREKILKESESSLRRLQEQELRGQIQGLLSQKVTIAGIDTFIVFLKDKTFDHLLSAADFIRRHATRAFVFIVSSSAGKDIFVAATTQGAADEGVALDVFIKRYGTSLGIKGGGRGLLAQGVFIHKPDSARITSSIKEFLSQGREQ